MPIKLPTIWNGPVVPFARRKPDAKPYEIKAAAKDTAEVWLYDVIGDSWEGTTGKQFATDLKALGDVKTLNIFINSPGGSVFDGVAIYNVLRRHKARKVVQIDGIAASIASVIAMAGDEIRIALNGMMMIHDPWSIAIGTAEDFRKSADALDKVRESILNTYVERATATEDDLSAWMTAETWFTAEEAVDAGLADDVTDEVAMAAFAGLDVSAFKHPPEALVAAITEAPAADPEPIDEPKPHPAVAVMKARAVKHGMHR